MAEPTPDKLVTARWLGGPVSIPALGVTAEYGDEVTGVPLGEATASDNWEVVSKTKPKTGSDD